MRSKLTKASARFWHFFEQEQPTWPLAFFRIGLGIICMGKMLVLLPSFIELYGQYGFIQWTISKFSNYPFLPHIGDMSLWIAETFRCSTDTATYTLLYIYLLLCAMLILGVLTRVTTIVLFILHLAFINTGEAVIYGVDVFTQMALFYGMFFPLGSAYALDNVLGLSSFKKSSKGAGIAIRCIQIQMCLVYFSTTIEKSLGIQWWNGEAIWRTFMMPIFKTYDFAWVSGLPWLAVLTGVLVLIVEGGYIFTMWIPKLRTLWLLMIILLHLVISVVMGMWFFGFVMVFLSLFAFGKDARKDLLPILARHRLVKNFRDSRNHLPDIAHF